ncbi:MAG TPA: CoA transferase [Acidimicrobiia bacterium]|jgi:crotonobetainyl-CoA:carnitine CoA-transferase CaiB-like acyl-CoA transferase|nr:CoA transferase [Acidimicrobiia bacterium]
MRQLLSDVTVVELASDTAGSYCGKVFADLGADVLKLETPEGDPERQHPERFVPFNTNKRAELVATDEAGRDRVLELLAAADVVVESQGEGDLARFGLTRDAVRAELPSLVVTTISGFGTTGPYAAYTWSDLVAQTAAWVTFPQGRAVEIPVKSPRVAALCSVGHTAALGALSGVLRARASGAGAHVDCAAFEALGTIPARVCRYLGWEYAEHVPLLLAANAADTLLPTGVFPCADGYVSMMSTPQQLEEMLEVLDDDALKAAFARPDAFGNPETKEILDIALYPWLFEHTRAEATALAQAAQWPLAGVYTPAEVMEADHFYQRGFWTDSDDPVLGPVLLPGAPYRHAEGGWRLHHAAPTPPAAGTRVELPRHEPPAVGTRSADEPPLRGIRVLDFTTVWSGPYLTQLLADLGAEVIRVENPSVFPPTTKGYLARPDPNMLLGSLLSMYAPAVDGVEDRPYNRHAMNNSIARNKLSCTIDPRRPEARELLMRLVEHSDVFVENLKMSTLHQIGIHETQLLERNPRLLVLRIPPAGLTGDYANYTGFGAQFDGLSGFAQLIGHHDIEMVETPATMYMDAATGPAGAFAVLAALHYRAATGRGQLIELAQIENVLNQLGDAFLDVQLGRDTPRTGNRDPEQAPQGIYRCRADESLLAITARNDAEWEALARAIGRADLVADPRFATVAGRYEHHDELDAAISAWTQQQDLMDAFHTLQQAGVTAGPQFTEELLADDPHVAAREWIRPLASRDVGTYPHIGFAFRGIPQAWDRGSPVLGEDNDYVFRKVVQLDDEEYQRYVDAKIIVDDYLDADMNPV